MYTAHIFVGYSTVFFWFFFPKIVKIGSYLPEYSFAWHIWASVISLETDKYFDVLLTVHLSIFISVINQLDAQNCCFTISLFHASTCFEHMCSSSGGGRLVHGLREDLSQPVHETATYRCDDTRGCVMQF